MSPLERWKAVSFERWMIVLTIIMLFIVGGWVTTSIDNAVQEIRINRVILQENHDYLTRRNQQLIEDNRKLLSNNQRLTKLLLNMQATQKR